jgi:hypothetical protein
VQDAGRCVEGFIKDRLGQIEPIGEHDRRAHAAVQCDGGFGLRGQEHADSLAAFGDRDLVNLVAGEAVEDVQAFCLEIRGGDGFGCGRGVFTDWSFGYDQSFSEFRVSVQAAFRA